MHFKASYSNCFNSDQSKTNKNYSVTYILLSAEAYNLDWFKVNQHYESGINKGYLFFSVKDRNLFHRVDTIGNILTSGAATSENITDGVNESPQIYVSWTILFFYTST